MTTATLAEPAPHRTGHRVTERSTVMFLTALAIVALLQVALVFTKSINWDEFFHFSEIHARRAGEPVDWLQTPYSYLFGFVTRLPGSVIDHIQYTRLLIMPFEALLVASVVVAARRFVDWGPALAAGLIYLSAGYVFTQALSLRADIIAASLVMAAVAIGLHQPLRPLTLCVIALLCALAFVSTIKILLYLPVVLGVLVVRRDSVLVAWPVISGLALASAALAVFVAMAYPEAPAYLVDKLGRSAARMFGGDLLPQGRYAVRQIAMAIPFALVLVAFIPWLVRASATRADRAALALFVLPALWPLVYFNAYPYFYAFMLPPVAVGLAPVVATVIQRYGAMSVAIACALSAILLFALEPRDQLGVQRAFDAEVREIFPRPVRYIDDSGMIGDYPRAVPHYASGWALAKYRRAEVAEYRASVLERPVPLLIANSQSLALVFDLTGTPNLLLAEDAEFLRANYLPHGGMIYVAGKRLAPKERLTGELLPTPGTYRVEGGPMSIDDRVLSPGAIVTLSQGRYDFANLSDTPAALRWAEAGEPRNTDIALRDMFTDF
ncbi:hypothetical protein GCM10023208_27250 [Erythrobacter westpacificensis]|uniref:Glycosyltransferase RgtA/B/C/D-like domain-containing protein n=1 Tax=Erythrobacter westpacificensis TaxID=1055231 RepID=A0ABP9KJ51_9SPHN